MEPHGKQRADLTHGPIGRQFVGLAAPMMIGILAMMGFNMVDTLFVGRLGTISLAAMAVTFPVVMVLTSISLGLSVSTSIAVSQAIGRGEPEAVRRLTTDALSLGMVIALVFMMIAPLAIDPILHLLEGELPTHTDAAAYLRIWFLGLPFVILPMVGNMAIRATGDTVTPSALIIIGIAINAILDPLLIFGFGPFPRLGIEGAAWATVIARGLTVGIVWWILQHREHMLVSPAAGWHTVTQSWRLLLRNGIPIALNNLISPIRMGIFTRLSAGLGAAAVAGLGVGTRVEAVGLAPVLALQSVIGIFMGQNVGAGRWNRVDAAIRLVTRFAFLWGCTMLIVFTSMGDTISSWFNDSPGVVAAACMYYAVAGITFGFRGVYFTSSAGLNSLNYSIDATILTALHGLGIGALLAWGGAHLWGLPGIFAGIAAGNVFGGITTCWWLTRRAKQRARISA